MQDLTDEQRLLQKLRVNYDPAVRPVYDAKSPVVINLGITLTQIIDVVSSLVITQIIDVASSLVSTQITDVESSLVITQITDVVI